MTRDLVPRQYMGLEESSMDMPFAASSAQFWTGFSAAASLVGAMARSMSSTAAAAAAQVDPEERLQREPAAVQQAIVDSVHLIQTRTGSFGGVRARVTRADGNCGFSALGAHAAARMKDRAAFIAKVVAVYKELIAKQIRGERLSEAETETLAAIQTLIRETLHVSEGGTIEEWTAAYEKPGVWMSEYALYVYSLIERVTIVTYTIAPVAGINVFLPQTIFTPPHHLTTEVFHLGHVALEEGGPLIHFMNLEMLPLDGSNGPITTAAGNVVRELGGLGLEAPTPGTMQIFHL